MEGRRREGEKELMDDIEPKYSPSNIHVLTASHFFLEEFKTAQEAPGHIPLNEYHISIYIAGEHIPCYRIYSKVNGLTQISEAMCPGILWHITESSILSKNRDRLGTVKVQRGQKILKEYPNYEDFWDEIKHGG
jgi:hypothetical protein